MKIFSFWKRQTPLVMQMPFCECGSPDIEAYACLSWSNELQDWQISEVRDRGTCGDCGSTDAKIVWRNKVLP